MREELLVFIQDNYIPEKQQLLSDCFLVLEDYNLEDYDNSFIELLMLADNEDIDTNRIKFEIEMLTILIRLAASQGVQLSMDSSLLQAWEVNRALIDIQFYEDKDSIQRTLESEFTNEEKLAELFRLVNLNGVDYFMTFIQHVEEDIFVKIQELYRNNEEAIEEIEITKEESDKILLQLKQLILFLKYERSVGVDLIVKGGKVGMVFDHYIKHAKKQLEHLSDTEVAKEMLILLFMSSDTYSSPISEFNKRSNLLFDDINRISKINIEMVKQLNLFFSFQASQLKTIADQNTVIEKEENA